MLPSDKMGISGSLSLDSSLLHQESFDESIILLVVKTHWFPNSASQPLLPPDTARDTPELSLKGKQVGTETGEPHSEQLPLTHPLLDLKRAGFFPMAGGIRFFWFTKAQTLLRHPSPQPVAARGLLPLQGSCKHFLFLKKLGDREKNYGARKNSQIAKLGAACLHFPAS